MLRNFWNDEAGVIISAELVLVMTITVLAMVVGLQALSKTINHELNDVAQAWSGIDQSFSYEGIANESGDCEHAEAAGSGFKDEQDDCDCTELTPVNPTSKDDNNNNRGEDGQ